MSGDESNPLPYQGTRDARAERLASGRRTATTWVVLAVVWILGLVSWTVWIGAVGIAILAVFSR
jgi:hypothetical protein